MLSVNVDNLFDKTIVIDILLTVGMFEKDEEFDVLQSQFHDGMSSRNAHNMQ